VVLFKWLMVGVAIRITCEVRVMSIHEYSTIWVNTNLTYLLNGSRFFNPSITHLLNKLIVLTCLSDFIKICVGLDSAETHVLRFAF